MLVDKKQKRRYKDERPREKGGEGEGKGGTKDDGNGGSNEGGGDNSGRVDMDLPRWIGKDFGRK